jgi:hypothetical protein
MLYSLLEVAVVVPEVLHQMDLMVVLEVAQLEELDKPHLVQLVLEEHK